MNEARATYPSLMKWFHWGMAVAVIALLGVGIWMADFLPEKASYRLQVYDLHKAIGLSVLALVLVRLLVRFRSQVPPAEASLKSWEKMASHAAHWALYLCMILMPLSGWVMSNSYGYTVTFFGWDLPKLFPESRDTGSLARAAHGWIGYIMIGIVLTHVGAVIKHRFIDRRDVLYRMWP